jgi:hypothetical protein
MTHVQLASDHVSGTQYAPPACSFTHTSFVWSNFISADKLLKEDRHKERAEGKRDFVTTSAHVQ